MDHVGTETLFRAQKPITFTVVGKYVSGYSKWPSITEYTCAADIYIEPLRSEDIACIVALKDMAANKEHRELYPVSLRRRFRLTHPRCSARRLQDHVTVCLLLRRRADFYD